MGKSAGWAGDLDRSTFTHRRETLTAPANADSLWVVLTSAGPPTSVGLITIEGLTISHLSADHPPEVILRSPAAHEGLDLTATSAPGWMVDGIRPKMAKLLHIGSNPPSVGLAIVDDDPNSHAEWHTTKLAAPHIAAGERLLVEWNEVYSIGTADRIEMNYPVPPPGVWPFRVQGLDVFGNPSGAESVIYLSVPAPLWRRPWFLALAILAACAALFAVYRYMVHRKMHAELVLIRQETMLEQERLRIARDIHDDLGARATHISLLSAMAEEHATSSEKARASFEQISTLTRDLVFALYQTVWAVNPENDNVDALANHLCQIATKLCEPAKLSCRLHVSELPHPSPISSDVRHQISMTVGEAINNAVKHAGAKELSVSLSIENSALVIQVRDDGRGFDLATVSAGNGLGNMHRRIEEIGGALEIESAVGQGTLVRLTLPLSNV
jgi:signal transduction histidine kinase